MVHKFEIFTKIVEYKHKTEDKMKDFRTVEPEIKWSVEVVEDRNKW